MSRLPVKVVGDQLLLPPRDSARSGRKLRVTTLPPVRRPPSKEMVRRMSARQAWVDRRRVLSHSGRSGLVRLFVTTALEQANSGLSVEAAARSASVSIRHLARAIVGELGVSPGIVLNLMRVARVADALAIDDAKLINIAATHRFSGAPGMIRLFKCFVGMTPGAYRSAIAPRRYRDS